MPQKGGKRGRSKRADLSLGRQIYDIAFLKWEVQWYEGERERKRERETGREGDSTKLLEIAFIHPCHPSNHACIPNTLDTRKWEFNGTCLK